MELNKRLKDALRLTCIISTVSAPILKSKLSTEIKRGVSANPIPQTTPINFNYLLFQHKVFIRADLGATPDGHAHQTQTTRTRPKTIATTTTTTTTDLSIRTWIGRSPVGRAGHRPPLPPLTSASPPPFIPFHATRATTLSSMRTSRVPRTARTRLFPTAFRRSLATAHALWVLKSILFPVNFFSIHF